MQNSISGSLPCISDTDVVAILMQSNFNFKILVRLILNGEENDMLNTLKSNQIHDSVRSNTYAIDYVMIRDVRIKNTQLRPLQLQGYLHL